MKKLMLFAVSLVCAAVSAYAQQPSTGAADAGVPVEEYVPKVIIEGKWGTGPGEFGYDGFRPEGASPEDFYPMSPSFSPDDFIHPRSLAVDSKGNVYVLDTANQRIQKFSGEGKYLLSLKVDSWNGYKLRGDGGDGYVYGLLGINIVVDSKDDLYYYLKRTKDGKESGEVWRFRSDRLVKKIPFENKRELPAKFQFTPVGHDQEELIVVGDAVSPVPDKYNIEIKKIGEVARVQVRDLVKKTSRKIEIGPTEAYLAAKARSVRAKNDVHLEKILDNGNIRLRVVSGSVDALATEEREYTPEGKLVRRIKSPPGYSHGLNVDGEGVKIVRWEIR